MLNPVFTIGELTVCHGDGCKSIGAGYGEYSIFRCFNRGGTGRLNDGQFPVALIVIGICDCYSSVLRGICERRGFSVPLNRQRIGFQLRRARILRDGIGAQLQIRNLVLPAGKLTKLDLRLRCILKPSLADHHLQIVTYRSSLEDRSYIPFKDNKARGHYLTSR